jgi:hypothetical protein
MPCTVFVVVECQRQPATSMRIALAYGMLPEAVGKEAREHISIGREPELVQTCEHFRNLHQPQVDRCNLASQSFDLISAVRVEHADGNAAI